MIEISLTKDPRDNNRKRDLARDIAHEISCSRRLQYLYEKPEVILIYLKRYPTILSLSLSRLSFEIKVISLSRNHTFKGMIYQYQKGDISIAISLLKTNSQ